MDIVTIYFNGREYKIDLTDYDSISEFLTEIGE